MQTPFSACLASWEKVGSSIVFTQDNDQLIVVDVCDADLQMCGNPKLGQWELTSGGRSFSFDPAQNPSGITFADVLACKALCNPGPVDQTGEFELLCEKILAQGETLTEILNSLELLCEKLEQPKRKYIPTGEFVSNQDSPFCGKPAFICFVDGVADGKCYVYTGDDNKTLEPLPMATTFTPYASGDSPKVCADAQCSLTPLLPADSGTLQTVLDAMIAAKGLVFNLPGKAPVPVTADDVVNVTIVRKRCDANAVPPIEADWVEINGEKVTTYNDDQDGGVDLTTTVTIPATGCSLASACFEKCWTKEELAALPAAG